MNARHVYVLVFLFIAFQVNAQESAGEYMSRLAEENGSIQNDTWSYLKASAHGRNARKVDKRRQELIATMKKASYSIKKAGTYEGDATLRDALVKYLTMSQLILQENYGKIVDLEKIAEESYDAMEAYLRAKKEAGEKLSAVFDELDSAQSVFAQKHNINLVEGEQSKKSQKIEEASETMDYYNKIYLIFFKSYKQEMYVLRDYKDDDIGAFEQDKNTLNTFSTEGLKQIEEIGSYKGDPAIKLIGAKLMRFYQDESDKKLEVYSDMVLIQEKFEKISKYVEAKKPANRTQEDVDKYNSMLKDYNAQVNKVNAVNEELNKKRSDLLDEWNKDSEKFMARHVPK
ncbi:LIC11966 family surface protein [Fulvivirga ligni]|uniref:LIC11966 family surface protein n=1 Tax=Fulvivirga ligni TaxID=2904246 RepID=UPI001F34560E|nr:hypothetical protein [Fulvivirga ligni]UII20994.1 hypothetical protein LVD16_24420 [Fulvivirga ligni]